MPQSEQTRDKVTQGHTVRAIDGQSWCHLNVLDPRNMHANYKLCTLCTSKVSVDVKMCRWTDQKTACPWLFNTAAGTGGCVNIQIVQLLHHLRLNLSLTTYLTAISLICVLYAKFNTSGISAHGSVLNSLTPSSDPAACFHVPNFGSLNQCTLEELIFSISVTVPSWGNPLN